MRSIYLKVVNYPKNLGRSKKSLNKVSFMYYCEIINI